MSYPLVKLGDCVEILSGFAFKSELFSDKENGLPLIRIRDVVDGKSKTYYSGDYSDEYIVNDGDMLIGMDGDFNRAKWQGGKALLNQRVCKVTADEITINQGYLYHLLPKKLEKIHAITSAVTVKHLSVKGIKDIEIPLPPLPEQKRIAAILDKADSLRRKRQQAMQLADEFLRAVFLELFGDPVTNPKGWERCKFENLVDMVTYGLTVRPEYHEEGIPLISAREIKSGEINFNDSPKISDSDFAKLSKKGLPNFQDILFSKTGSIGHCAIVESNTKFAVTQNAARIVPNTEKCEPLFLLSLLRTKYFFDLANREAKGNAVKDLQLGIMKEFPVYAPPLDIQKQYVEIFKRCKNLKYINFETEINVNNLFNSLSQKAFAGEL